MISLIQLEYIIAVDTYRHFATAAEKCFVTQPTLSMQLKKVEEELGLLLFDRSKQPVIPTDAGKAIVEQARQVLKEFKKIEGIAEGLKDNISGDLHIGIIPTLSTYLLPLFAGPFSRLYPKVKLHVQEYTSELIVELLKKDQLDVGLLVTPLNDSAIRERVLFYEEIQLYAHPDHPLADLPEPALEDITLEGLWLLAEGHCFRHQVLNLCAYNKASEEQKPFHFESGSLETLRKLVDAEGGFTLLPELATIDLPEEKQFQIKRFAGPRPLREVSLVCSRHFAKERLLDLLAGHLQKMVPPQLRNHERGLVVEWR
jgi:LysR family hydrogen peroxide-inducible transcriptional activator